MIPGKELYGYTKKFPRDPARVRDHHGDQTFSQMDLEIQVPKGHSHKLSPSPRGEMIVVIL